MDKVKYDFGYMFKYSVRTKYTCGKNEDDIPENIKQRRLAEIIDKQQAHSLKHMKKNLEIPMRCSLKVFQKKSAQHFYMEELLITQLLFLKKEIIN